MGTGGSAGMESWVGKWWLLRVLKVWVTLGLERDGKCRWKVCLESVDEKWGYCKFMIVL